MPVISTRWQFFDCRRFGSYWIVEGKLLAEPSEDVMHALMTAPTMTPDR